MRSRNSQLSRCATDAARAVVVATSSLGLLRVNSRPDANPGLRYPVLVPGPIRVTQMRRSKDWIMDLCERVQKLLIGRNRPADACARRCVDRHIKASLKLRRPIVDNVEAEHRNMAGPEGASTHGDHNSTSARPATCQVAGALVIREVYRALLVNCVDQSRDCDVAALDQTNAW